MEDNSRKNVELNEENAEIESVQNVSSFRRILPQVIKHHFSLSHSRDIIYQIFSVLGIDH